MLCLPPLNLRRKKVQAHQLLVVEEKKQLDERIEALYDFIVVFQGFFETLPEDEQERLKRQLEIMKQYSEILEERIKHFN